MHLYYVHDPMCSWCWAFRPVYLQLVENLPKPLTLTRLLGGLAADSDTPMSEKTRQYVLQNWQRIEQEVPDTRFNYAFWQQCEPRRSTYPACRAVIAARIQGAHLDEAMTEAIQKAYYLQARNPSDTDTLISLASEIGCQQQQFAQDLASDHVNDILHNELTLSRRLQLNSFPGLLLVNQRQHTHIAPNYHSIASLLDTLASAMHS